MSDYRVEIKVKNQRLFRVMKESGCKNIAELSRLTGAKQTELGSMMNLQTTAYNNRGDLRPSVARLCDRLMVSPDQIFPPDSLYNPVLQNTFVAEVTEQQIAALAQADPFDEACNDNMNTMLDQAMSQLTKREQTVLRLRFGLGGQEPLTLEEAGKNLGVTGEDICGQRVRQIEAKALRKLRNPRVSKPLQDFVEA